MYEAICDRDIRGQLFKISDGVSSRFVKISNGNITNTLLFLLIKCENQILSTKNNSVFAFEVGFFEQLAPEVVAVYIC